MSRKGSLPSKKKILEFWWPKLKELEKVDVYTLDSDCFCCGLNKFLERAHIKPECQGGANTVENLHLLCKSCHIESEGMCGDIYWDWFKSKDIYEESDRKFANDLKFAQNVLDRWKKQMPDTDFTKLSLDELRTLAAKDLSVNI